MRLVQEGHVRRAPVVPSPGARSEEQALLVLVEEAVGGLLEPGPRAEQAADEALGVDDGPCAVEHAVQVAAALHGALDVLEGPIAAAPSSSP